MAFGYKITGMENITKAIQAKREEIKGVFEKNLNEGADKIVSSAKSKAPVLSGNLQNSITKNEFWDRNGRFSIYAGIPVNAIFTKADGWYARMQEYGTSKMKAQPYLRPAFDENKSAINNATVEDLKGILK